MTVAQEDSVRFVKTRVRAVGIKFVKVRRGCTVARARLYILWNDAHDEPFGFLEDVFVLSGERGSGIGTALVRAVIREVKRRSCYKLIATSRRSRPRVHALYRRLGFTAWGTEFRMDFARRARR